MRIFAAGEHLICVGRIELLGKIELHQLVERAVELAFRSSGRRELLGTLLQQEGSDVRGRIDLLSPLLVRLEEEIRHPRALVVSLRIANPAVDPGKALFAGADLRVHAAQLGAERGVRIGKYLVAVTGETAALREEILAARRNGRVALGGLRLAIVLAVRGKVMRNTHDLDRL